MNKNLMKVYKYLGLLFLLILPVSCFACPGCSMLNLHISFLHPADVKWAYAIVLFIFAVPLALYLLGFRLKKVEECSKIEKWGFTVLLFFGWLLMISIGNYSPNFGIFLMHWFYLPLVIQLNIGIVIAFLGAVGMILCLIFSVFLIPLFYCYRLSSFLLKYKIEKKCAEILS